MARGGLPIALPLRWLPCANNAAGKASRKSSSGVPGNWHLKSPNPRVVAMSETSSDEPSEGVEVVYAYTLKDALEDGVLVDLHAIGKIPVYAPVYGYIRYATSSLLSKGYETQEGFNLPNLADLLVQAL